VFVDGKPAGRMDNYDDWTLDLFPGLHRLVLDQ